MRVDRDAERIGNEVSELLRAGAVGLDAPDLTVVRVDEVQHVLVVIDVHLVWVTKWVGIVPTSLFAHQPFPRL